jgi:hypothetical protein
VRTGVLLAAVLLAGCFESNPQPSPGGKDSGGLPYTGADATIHGGGEPADTATSSGEILDGAPDGWAAREDAGAEVFDAGAEVFDAGAEVFDAAPEVFDAAPEVIPWDCPAPLPAPDCDPDGGLVSINGNAQVFGPPYGYVKQAPVTLLEFPSIIAMTDDKGNFVIPYLPPCVAATLVIEAPGFTTTQTETFFTGKDGLEGVAIQVPSEDVFALLAGILGGVGGEDLCQVASTISVAEMSLENYIVPHGVPGATATVCPWPGPGHGPIYFEYISDALILPDPALTESSVDGGVIFKDLAPGLYTLRAHKEGTAFREVTITCSPGAFVNAGPPQGLHELD